MTLHSTNPEIYWYWYVPETGEPTAKSVDELF